MKSAVLFHGIAAWRLNVLGLLRDGLLDAGMDCSVHYGEHGERESWLPMVLPVVYSSLKGIGEAGIRTGKVSEDVLKRKN